MADATLRRYHVEMETRSNVWLVGGTLLVLVLMLLGYIAWATPDKSKRSREYEIVFDKSVAGLQEGSAVTFSGISVGRVEDISFDPEDPSIVRVRILINNADVPIVQGVTAGLDRDLFGTALVTLDGAHAGAPAIVAYGGNELPVIPVQKGGGLLDDPVSTVESISKTVDRLNGMLTPAGQRSISQEIADLERQSAKLANNAPGIADKIAAGRAQLLAGGKAAEQMGTTAAAMDAKLRANRGKAREMRASLRSTRAQLESLDQRIAQAKDSVGKLGQPELQDSLRTLHGSTSELRDKLVDVESGGLGSQLSKPKLPDFKPPK